MDESVRFSTERVASVGWSLAGGGRDVCSGLKRMALAVVSWFAMCRWAKGGVLERDCSGAEELGWAVLTTGNGDVSVQGRVS
jgi:hypothetical protein